MKRYKPDEVNRTADMWIRKIDDCLPIYGGWNHKKVLRAIESKLRARRLDVAKGDKSAG